MWMGRYLYALFIPNLILYLIALVALAPLWGGAALVYPPLRFYCENHALITAQLNGGANGANLALKEAAETINTVLSVLEPGFKIWNIVIDGLLWVGVELWQWLDCQIGQECEGVEQLFRFVRNIVPFGLNLFYIFWQGVGSIFSVINPAAVLTVDDPYNLTLTTMPNGSVYAIDTFTQNGEYQRLTRLDEKMADGHTHRFVLARKQFLTEGGGSQKREPNPFTNCGPGTPNLCIHPSATCMVGPVNVCNLIAQIVDELFSNQNVFVILLQIIDLLVNRGLALIKDALEFFLDVILPFFEWLIGFIGGDLIGYFADLFSKVNALFTWVGDVWDSFIDVFTDALDTIFDTFDNLIDELDIFFDNVWGNLQDLFDNILDSFDAILQEISEFFAQEIKDLIDDLESTNINIPSPGSSLFGSIIPLGRVAPNYDNSETSSSTGRSSKRKEETMDAGNTTYGYQKRSTSVSGGYGHSPTGPVKEGRVYSPRRYQMKNRISSLRDLGYGNLTSAERTFCREALRYGIDLYTATQLPVMERMYLVVCLSIVEATEYKAEVVAHRTENEQSGNAQSPPVSPEMSSAKYAMRQVRSSIKEGIQSVRAKKEEFRRRSEFIRSSTPAEFAEHTEKRRSEGHTTYGPNSTIYSASPAEAWVDLARVLRNATSHALGFESGSTAPEAMKERTRRFTERHGDMSAHVSKIKKSWDDVKKQPKMKSILEDLSTLSKMDFSMHWIQARYPEVAMEGTAAHHAYREVERFNDAWDSFGKFVSKGPEMHEIGHYLHRGEGTELVSMLKQSVEGAKLRRIQGRNSMLSRGLQRRGAAGDFWDFLTVGLWETIGDLILNAVNFFAECNPLPEPEGPGGDPNSDVSPERHCLPYWDPKLRLPVDDIRIPFDLLFPTCCPAGFDCPSEYKQVWGQLRFLMRFTTLELNIWWGWLTWIPLFGPWWKSFTEFPGGKVPDFGFYCFFTCLSEVVLGISVGVFIIVTLVVWIIVLILIIWALVTCGCACAFCCCRLCFIPCGFLTPRSKKNLTIKRDFNAFRAIASTVPCCGCLAPKGGRVAAFTAFAGFSGMSLGDFIDEDHIGDIFEVIPLLGDDYETDSHPTRSRKAKWSPNNFNKEEPAEDRFLMPTTTTGPDAAPGLRVRKTRDNSASVAIQISSTDSSQTSVASLQSAVAPGTSFSSPESDATRYSSLSSSGARGPPKLPDIEARHTVNKAD